MTDPGEPLEVASSVLRSAVRHRVWATDTGIDPAWVRPEPAVLRAAAHLPRRLAGRSPPLAAAAGGDDVAPAAVAAGPARHPVHPGRRRRHRAAPNRTTSGACGSVWNCRRPGCTTRTPEPGWTCCHWPGWTATTRTPSDRVDRWLTGGADPHPGPARPRRARRPARRPGLGAARRDRRTARAAGHLVGADRAGPARRLHGAGRRRR